MPFKEAAHGPSGIGWVIGRINSLLRIFLRHLGQSEFIQYPGGTLLCPPTQLGPSSFCPHLLAHSAVKVCIPAWCPYRGSFLILSMHFCNYTRASHFPVSISCIPAFLAPAPLSAATLAFIHASTLSTITHLHICCNEFD